MTMHVGQAAVNAVVVIAESLVIQTCQVQDGGVKVVNRGDVLNGLVAELIRGAISERRFDTRACGRACAPRASRLTKRRKNM